MPVGASYVMPSVDKLTDAMSEALVDCSKVKTRASLRSKARDFALDYDWNTVVKNYWTPLIKRLHKELTPRVYKLSA